MNEVSTLLQEVKRGRGRPPAYPFGAMKPHETFLSDSPLAKVSAAANMYAKRHIGYKFRCETMPDTRVRVTCEGVPE